MGKYFGTDGFRGEANVGLKSEHAYKIGSFLAYYFISNSNNKKFVIGRDTRLSGNMLEAALVAGLNSYGGDAYILGVTTTPCVAYLAKKEKFGCGIMISASHNPFYDNGIKLINSNGEKMEESIISKIEEYIDSKIELPLVKKELIGRSINYKEGIDLYINHLTKLGPDLSKLNIALDLANGSATRVAEDVFKNLGANFKVINNNPDGLNINANCGSTHIESLAKLLLFRILLNMHL